MSHYKPYPIYKDSGVEWLGRVPEGWGLCRIRYILSEKRPVKGRSIPAGAISFGEVVEKDMLNEETLETYQEVLPSEFLVNPINLNYDLKSLRVALCKIEVRVSPAYIVLRPIREMNQRFLRWLLYLFDVAHMKTLGAGVRQTITFEDIGNCQVVIPTESEQAVIAEILDRETARIDALIEKKTRFIELLREKRQALISHAVTKGLDPSVKMKDSDVEWLGAVPEHWAVKRLKFIATVQTGIAKGKDNAEKDTVEVPYLRVANVQDGYLNLEEVATIEVSTADLSRYLLQAGDVLMNEGGDFDKLGRGHVWHGEIEPCIHQNHVFAVRPHGVGSEWLNTFTSSAAAQFYFMGRSKQSTNLASISSSNLMELAVPLPCEKEQRLILDVLHRQTAQVNALVAQTECSLDLLKERRSALITAAVTGQIDLREVV